MKMDIMLDLETLGTKPGCAVLSIGAKVFDPYGDNSVPSAAPPSTSFYRNIDLFSSLMIGLTIDLATLDWWRTKDKTAQDAFLLGGVKPKTAIQQFNDWIVACGNQYSPLEKSLTVWAKSPGFDCHVLEFVADLVGYRLEWHDDERKQGFRTFRDVRTAIAMSGIDEKSITAKGTGRTQHNALDDCEVQILQVQAAYRMLKPVQPVAMPAPQADAFGAPLPAPSWKKD
jgi:hypothetical protein